MKLPYLIMAAAMLGAPTPARAADNEPEVLQKGPVHEAFAQPVDADANDSFVVPKAPPQAINEIAPEIKPEGDNVQWIGGYWSWDEERRDFLWVSGVWRDIPPGMRWVPGLFSSSAEGWRWSPGYWTPLEGEPLLVKDAPPASLDQGPSSPAPARDDLWIEGVWVWQGAWAWRTGYWVTPNPDWIWVPSHWVWTPRGYVFVPGYYDYLPERRGYLFAPVYYGPSFAYGVGYRWRPHVLISIDLMFGHLFCSPRHRHYYFGDYYDARYSGLGYYPWFAVGPRRHRDPLYGYSVWYQRRQDPDWDNRQQREYENRRQHPEARAAVLTMAKPISQVDRQRPMPKLAPPPKRPEAELQRPAPRLVEPQHAIPDRRIEPPRAEPARPEPRFEPKRPEAPARVEPRRVEEHAPPPPRMEPPRPQPPPRIEPKRIAPPPPPPPPPRIAPSPPVQPKFEPRKPDEREDEQLKKKKKLEDPKPDFKGHGKRR